MTMSAALDSGLAFALVVVFSASSTQAGWTGSDGGEQRSTSRFVSSIIPSTVGALLMLGE